MKNTALGLAVRRASLALALLGACDQGDTDSTEGTAGGGKADDAEEICDDGDPNCTRDDGFSRVAGAALDAMSAYEDDRYAVWNYGRNAEFDSGWILQTPPADHWGEPGDELVLPQECPEDAEDCDPDFELQRCEDQDDCTRGGECRPVLATMTRPGQEPAKLCVGHSDFLYDEFYEAMIQAQERVTLTTLSEPDGRFEAAIRNAMTYLAAAGEPVEVAMLYGIIVNTQPRTEKLMNSLLRDVPRANNLNVWVGAYRAGFSSWNHSKIIAVDDQVLVQGGHNHYTHSYLEGAPVHDISMRVHGGPVLDAHRYAQELWRPICDRPTSYALTDVSTSPDDLGNCPDPYDGLEPEKEDGGMRYISAGRLGKLGENPTDDGILAMFDAAQDSIRLSLQDLGPMQLGPIDLGDWPEPVIGALARAVARGVDVYVVLSTNRSGSFDDYGNGWEPEEAVQAVYNWLADNPEFLPEGSDPTTVICEHYNVTTIRASDEDQWPDGRNVGNHAKFAMVDDVAFYMGSQNLYDANHAEYGLIIDDADAAEQLLDEYWDPMWNESARAAVSGAETDACL